MAPEAAIAASIPAGVAFAGGALPLAVVFALIACLFSAWSIAELARELPAAGSLATYAARGLHPAIGFLVAWGYVLVGWLIPPLVLLQLGFTVAGTLHAELSGYPANLWWPWAILGALIVLAAGHSGMPVLDPRLPRNRELHHRERERGSERLQQDSVRDGPDQGVSLVPRSGQRQAPLPRQRHCPGDHHHHRRHAGLGFGYDPVTAFYMVAPARTAAWRGGVHPGMV